MIPQPTVVHVDGIGGVGVYEFGARDGRPVLTFHGTPACGAGFDWADEPATARDLRIIPPDRPGVGLSTPIDDWSVRDYPPIVAALADALEVDRFAVWGYSGGGPYAIATAAAHPDRVVAAAIAAGMGEVGTFAAPDDFARTDRQFLALSLTRPMVARALLRAAARFARLSPKAAVRNMEKELSESDVKVIAQMGEPRDAVALFTQAVMKSARGVVDDYRSIARTWGVDFESIRVPVKIFQGTADTMVPLRHAEGLVERIPGAEFTAWPGEGHLGPVTHVDEILDWLAAQFARQVPGAPATN